MSLFGNGSSGMLHSILRYRQFQLSPGKTETKVTKRFIGALEGIHEDALEDPVQQLQMSTQTGWLNWTYGRGCIS